MKRFFSSLIAVATLVGIVVLAEVAEAGKIRSPIERRLRPGRGFWSNGSSQSRSYSSGYYTPQYRSVPQQQYVMPQQQYSPYRYYTVQPPTYHVTQPATVTGNAADEKSQTTVQTKAANSGCKQIDSSKKSQVVSTPKSETSKSEPKMTSTESRDSSSTGE